MQITINVDESMFKDVIDKELAAFSKEEMHGLVTDMLKQYLSESDVLKHLFIEDRFNSNYYGNNGVTHHPTELLRKTVESVDINEDMTEIKDSIVKMLKEDSDQIVMNLFIQMISRSICKMVRDDSEINELMQTSIHNAISERMNR